MDNKLLLWWKINCRVIRFLHTNVGGVTILPTRIFLSNTICILCGEKNTYLFCLDKVNPPLNIPFNTCSNLPNIDLKYTAPFLAFLTLNKFTPEQVFSFYLTKLAKNWMGLVSNCCSSSRGWSMLDFKYWNILWSHIYL